MREIVRERERKTKHTSFIALSSIDFDFSAPVPLRAASVIMPFFLSSLRFLALLAAISAARSWSCSHGKIYTYVFEIIIIIRVIINIRTYMEKETEK